MKQILDLPYGQNYKLHENIIKSYFANKPTYMKGDFHGAFYLKYENQEFDLYGKGDIEFHYIKNMLVSTEIDLEFFSERFSQIKNIQKLFQNELTNNNTFFLDEDSFGTTENVESELLKCIEKGRGDISQNKFLFGRYWRSDKIPKSNSFTTSQYISLNSNGLKSCRGLMSISFSKLDLSLIQMRADNGMRYLSEEEYPKREIKLNFENGVFKLPILINTKITLDFILDLGAADVSISSDVYQVLLKTGTITNTDFIGEQVYKLADGTSATTKVILLKELKIGDIEIRNVRTSISTNVDAPLLLGQSALKQLGKYQIDNKKSILIIE